MNYMQWVEEIVQHPEEGQWNHWSCNEDIDLNDADEVIELIQTGSITTKVNGKSWVVELVNGGKMTQLYRITYARKGTPCSVTFSAPDVLSAADFSELWEKTCGCPVLTLKPIGVSKIPDIDYKRIYSSRRGSAAKHEGAA